nr:purine-nucleoside phosphorylase [Desulfobulbaceae bacterium]
MINPEKHLQLIDEAVGFIQSQLSCPPPLILTVQGTGQSFLPDGFMQHEALAYSQIPHFQIPTVPTHVGKLIIGTINNTTIAILQGRFHFYEGFEPHQIVFPLRVLNRLGCKTLIITNTAGGLNLAYEPGSLMVVTDHINNMGFNPLRGTNSDILGPRFPDMSRCYSKKLIKLTLQSAEKCGIKVHMGVYTGIPGPSLETPAETRFLRNCGADAVGMSTVPEVIAAHHLGMNILGISLIANVNNPDEFKPIAVDDVITQAQKAQGQIKAILSDLLQNHLT